MTDTIVVMPGVERRDIGEAVPSEQVLQFAIDNGVTDVVIVGRGRDGSLYLAAEGFDADATVGKLMRAVAVLTNSEIVQL